MIIAATFKGWAQVRQGYANGLDEEIEKMRRDRGRHPREAMIEKRHFTAR